MPEATKFADSITPDHLILAKDEDLSRKQERVACVIFDIFSKWLEAYGALTNDAESTRKAIKRFLGPQVAPEHIYSDNSKEIEAAIKQLDWEDRHDTSTPNRPATNGIAERCVRTVKEGIAAVLLQSGLSPEWWADAMRYFCFQHNIEDKLADGLTPYEKRFNESYNGPIFAFGQEIEYTPSSPKVKNSDAPYGQQATCWHFHWLRTRGRRPSQWRFAVC